jgi:hypothetical protein
MSECFADFFNQFLQSKGISSRYELSQLSLKSQLLEDELTQTYLSKLVNNSITKPGLPKRKAIAKAIAINTLATKLCTEVIKDKNLDKIRAQVIKDKNFDIFFAEALKDVNTFFDEAAKKFCKFSLKIDDEPISGNTLEEFARMILQKFDQPIYFKSAEKGCIVIFAETTLEVFEKVQRLYEEGKLSDLLGVNILNVQLEEQESEEYLESENLELLSETDLKWLQYEVQSNWNLENLKKVWISLGIPVLFDNIYLPRNLELAFSNVRKENNNTQEWKVSKIEIPYLSVVLITWLKSNNEDFDLIVQIYPYENQKYLLEDLELRLYSDNERLQVVKSGQSISGIQTDTYTFDWDESVIVHVLYQDFRFVYPMTIKKGKNRN